MLLTIPEVTLKWHVVAIVNTLRVVDTPVEVLRNLGFVCGVPLLFISIIEWMMIIAVKIFILFYNFMISVFILEITFNNLGGHI